MAKSKKAKIKKSRTTPVAAMNENELRSAVQRLRTMLTAQETENTQLGDQLTDAKTKSQTLAKEKKKAWSIAHSLLQKQNKGNVQQTGPEVAELQQMKADLEKMAENVADKGGLDVLELFILII